MTSPPSLSFPGGQTDEGERERGGHPTLGCGPSLGGLKNPIELPPRDTREWVQLPDMPTGRWAMRCGVVVGDGNGMAEVVVVGGELPPQSGNGYYLDTVEIFNVATESWRTGKNFTNT